MISAKQFPAMVAASTAVSISSCFLISCANSSKCPGINVKAHNRTNNPISKTLGSTPRITKDFIPPGNLNRRKIRKMNPRYITIHSTANCSPSADAEAHCRLLHRAGMGRLSWHFTVDQSSIYQTLPTDEQGQHADYEGTGNQQSIGIEMCENEGNCIDATIDRTARLTAHLMKSHNIPISRVVPHQYWRRVRPDGKDFGHKNCPRILMEDGKPGRKWNSFLKRVQSYR